MALRVTEEMLKESLSKELEQGEELLEVGYAYRAGTKFFFVGLTSSRIILQSVTATNKVKGTESLPISEIERAELEKGFKFAPLLRKIASEKVEHSIVIKMKDGTKHVLRFGPIMGMDNKRCPDRILERLRGPE